MPGASAAALRAQEPGGDRRGPSPGHRGHWDPGGAQHRDDPGRPQLPRVLQLGHPPCRGGVVGLGDVPARAWGWFGVCRGTLAYMLGSVMDRQLSPCRWAPSRRAAARYRGAQGGHPRPGDPWGARLQLRRPQPRGGRPPGRRVLSGAGQGCWAQGGWLGGLSGRGCSALGGTPRAALKGRGRAGAAASLLGLGDRPHPDPHLLDGSCSPCFTPLLPQACPAHSSPTAPHPTSAQPSPGGATSGLSSAAVNCSSAPSGSREPRERGHRSPERVLRSTDWGRKRRRG